MGEWRFVGDFGDDVWRQLACRLRRILRGVAAHESEIPAFAGMVCGGTGDCWWILALCGGQLADLATIWRSPVDHSCVGRNLTVWCRQMRQGRALSFEIPAFAGMVCGRMEGCWWIWLWATIWRRFGDKLSDFAICI